MQPGTLYTPWVNPQIEIRPSPLGGNGMFAREAIPIGDIVLIWGGTVFTREELLAGKANPESISVLDENLYLADPIDTVTADDYSLNHSCDPNVWMQDAITLIARRDIVCGEELTADYALWLYEQDWVLEPCRCGSPLCRGRITANDWKLPDLQLRYAGFFTPFLNRKISDHSG